MPHSVSPEAQSPSEQIMADVEATTQPVEDNDVTMADDDEPATTTNGDEKKDVKLEELFADVDSDEEFPSSSKPNDVKASSPPVAPSSPADEEDDSGPGISSSDPELLRMFYQRLFPFRYLFQWLNHSPTPTNDFAHREFALTILDAKREEIYLRYQSYPTADLIRKDIINKLPLRFEIGPIYSTNPRDRKTLRVANSFRPLQKELCFDIDLTDYDSIRTCCSKAQICIKCWQFMTMAIKTIDVALREDFGFKHILWVYSGRRGAHAWVCDKKARMMDDQRRRAIAGYLEVVRGGSQGGKKVNLWRPLHPHISRSLDLLAPHFQTDILSTQDPWSTPERAEHLLSLLPDRSLNDALRQKWEASPGRPSTSKWADIDSLAKSGIGGGSGKGGLDAKALLEAKQDVVLEYTYPRLDIEVSKKLNHLLKSPFVVHPGTGNVCVPIDTREGRLEEFDPMNVPTVQGLLAEIDGWKDSQSQSQGGEGEDGEGEGEEKKLADWEKTSLKPYIEQFRSFVIALMRDEREPGVKREREEEDGMEF
ncbi:DNA primase small subunit [Xylariaceae sp. FL0255]|nr:DNA primase small subunit [Xylariaceae sp. FL0255]